MKRDCFCCPKKTDCYTSSGLAKLKPGELCDCGALFFSTQEAEKLVALLVAAMRDRDRSTAAVVAAELVLHGYDRENVIECFDLSEDEVAMAQEGLVETYEVFFDWKDGRGEPQAIEIQALSAQNAVGMLRKLYEDGINVRAVKKQMLGWK